MRYRLWHLGWLPELRVVTAVRLSRLTVIREESDQAWAVRLALTKDGQT